MVELLTDSSSSVVMSSSPSVVGGSVGLWVAGDSVVG